MNIRLVAYRPATTSATSDTGYQLDLQQAPNISLNFQFSDVKNPETRKASYSQTFKLPFTDNNNAFFQTWFNVNLTTLVFSTRAKFDAILYVGTIPQFEGIIQLKGVYQKAQYYDVVLLSNAADLFTTIGSQKLRDVFKVYNNEGVFIGYSDELNHIFTESNFRDSWNGGSSSFQNTSEVSLRDTDVDVQKVMYPLCVTQEKFFYENSYGNEYLSMSNPDAYEFEDAQELMVDITQFRPSIQLKTLIKLILGTNGFSYTSAFIDGDYFGKLYMTTCNHITISSAPTNAGANGIAGIMTAGNSEPIWANYYIAGGYDYGCSGPNWAIVAADTTSPNGSFNFPNDPIGLFNTENNYFQKTDINQLSINVKFKMAASNVEGCTGNFLYLDYGIFPINTSSFEIEWWNQIDANTTAFTVTINDDNTVSQWVNFNISLADMAVGDSAVVGIKPFYFEKEDFYETGLVNFGTGSSPQTAGLYSMLTINNGFGSYIYGQQVDIPSCIDPSILQKDFLKDLIERFNLIIMSDPNDASNLIIEPYNDYLVGGEIKSWTDKVDLSKEVVVKDTTSLQKKEIILTDLEDVDLANKSFKEEQPEINVYGHLHITETNNEFAKGEMKNNPIFSPFINERVFQGAEGALAPNLLFNVAVQYEYTYKEVAGGYENILEATKPKLFYYNGATTDLLIAGGYSNIYLHRTSGITVVPMTFDHYPLCSPFEVSTTDGVGVLNNTTRSLYWNQNPPIANNVSCFSYNQYSVVSVNSLYFTYWEQYFNSIYHIDARIMECHLMLDEVDIFNFKFSDEIFIKDTYWRILDISNYQVGTKASTKVTLIKSGELYDSTCPDCDYVLATVNGNNVWGGNYYMWCPEDDPDCVPDTSADNNYPGIYTTPVCCGCAGGEPQISNIENASDGLYPCEPVPGSMPIKTKTTFALKSFFSGNLTQTLLASKISGSDTPFIIGKNNTKYAKNLLPYNGNDMIIKYNTSSRTVPQLSGENHRVVLSGHTDADTRGYAYVQGNSSAKALFIPSNTNMIIRVKGIATVIGGKSATYVLGTTEGFAYYTAFKNMGGTTTQLSTAGGQQEFSIREGANPTTCTLYIDVSADNELQFGLDDDQTDTKRIWQLTVDLDINKIYNLDLPYDANFALYQNGRNIEFQDENYLIWN